MTPLVDLKSVTKRRGTGGREFELFVPSLEIYAGQLTAIVGPSGSGKSTLLDILSLVLQPTDGLKFSLTPGGQREYDILSLWAQRRDKTLSGIRRSHFGYILQTGGLLPFLAVGKNVALSRDLIGKAYARKDVVSALDSLGVADQIQKMPGALSGGERQRVAIARALFHQPQIILADEPTAAVDQGRARGIMEDFKNRALDVESAVVVVTHDFDLVSDFADNWIRLERASKQADDGTVRYTCRQASD